MQFKDFYLEIVRGLIKEFGVLTNVATGKRVSTVIDRLGAVPFMDRHYPDFVPGVGNRKKGQRRYIVCSQTTKGEKK